MKGYIKIKKMNLEPDKFGQHIKVTMIGLYDEDDKWIKWIPLNEKLINFLLDQKIDVVINPDAL
jgi:hypothetical protein